MKLQNAYSVALRGLSALALVSGCATTSNDINFPRDVQDYINITQKVLDQSLEESIEEIRIDGYASGEDAEEKIEYKFPYRLDYNMFWDGVESWPITNLDGIDSLDYDTDKFKVEIDVSGNKVEGEVNLPTIIKKSGKTYQIDRYKIESRL